MKRRRRRLVVLTPRQVVGYIRVSTDRQDLSPEAQREAMTAWCKREGVTIVRVHEDIGVSGGADIDQRPGLMAALADLDARRADGILVARLDRLARDVLVTAMVERLAERAGARVLVADGTGNGDGPEAALLRHVVAAFAAFERAMIRSRTKAALAVKRAKGERVGAIPYGFRLAADGTHLEPVQEEQTVVRVVRALRAKGNPYRAICAVLEARGLKPRTGKTVVPDDRGPHRRVGPHRPQAVSGWRTPPRDRRELLGFPTPLCLWAIRPAPPPPEATPGTGSP